MKKRFFFFAIILVSFGILHSQVQIKKRPLQKKELLRALNVVSPNGGATWEIGTDYPIQWGSQGVFSPNMVKIALTSGNNSHWITSQSGTTNDGAHHYRPHWNNPPLGHYKLRISSLDGVVSDESDGVINVVPPPVDLSCALRSRVVTRNRMPYWEITITIQNKGSRTLNNVLFNWVITQDNVVRDQDGAGFGTMYPNKLYTHRLSHHMGRGNNRIEVRVDPDNRQGENQFLRQNNIAAQERRR
jgi:hypothetical protein